MKKSSTTKRAQKLYYETVQEFLENLSAVFPNDAELKDAILFNRNVVSGDEAKMKEGIEAWCENMAEPLKKGSAKYMKAVESITGAPACIYHAFTYRDTTAMYASTSSPSLLRLDLHTKMESTEWDESSKKICWEYLDELNKIAYDAIDPASQWATVPKVPTRDEIQNDIMRRKAAGTSSSNSGSTVSQGIAETFQKLCSLRGVTISCDADTIVDLITKASSHRIPDQEQDVGNLCRCHDPAGFFALLKHAFPDTDWGSDPPSDEEWDVLNKCIGLSSMRSAIPVPMMSGIETVANKIVNDIASGNADFNNLDVESIGQQVLSSVSTDEMNAFANNLDKILPALGHFKPI